MTDGLRILFFLTDAYGGFGGISRFNRDFLAALDASPFVARVHALPRIISEPITDSMPESVVYDHLAARGKFAFGLRSVRHLRYNGGVDLVICGHINLLPLAFPIAKFKGAPLALIVHGVEAWQKSGSPLANALAGWVDAVIAVSRLSTDRFVRWSGFDISRATIIPNCVDLDRFAPGPRPPSLVARYELQDCRVIMTLGRLAGRERYKGFDEVLDVMPALLKHVSGLKYLIVGDGSDRTRLETKAAMLGVAANVVFAGRIPESEKVAHYNLADAFVLPSSGEGFGIVLLEAAACGVPVVGSAVDGSREALLDGEIGDVVDPANPGALLDAILKALSSAPRKRRSAIETFGADRFRARVSHWAEKQAAAFLPQDRRTKGAEVQAPV